MGQKPNKENKNFLKKIIYKEKGSCGDCRGGDKLPLRGQFPLQKKKKKKKAVVDKKKTGWQKRWGFGGRGRSQFGSTALRLKGHLGSLLDIYYSSQTKVKNINPI